MSSLVAQAVTESCVSVMMPRCWMNETPFLTFLKNHKPFKGRIVQLRAGEDIGALLCTKKDWASN